MVQTTRSKLADPKIEQRQISQNAVGEFGRKSAIYGWQIGGSQMLVQDSVGKFFSATPFRQDGESDGA
jgi:hypothetical protein